MHTASQLKMCCVGCILATLLLPWHPTCSSGNTVHLTGAVTGVKRNTVRCGGARMGRDDVREREGE